jgi:hypothetical protein
MRHRAGFFPALCHIPVEREHDPAQCLITQDHDENSEVKKSRDTVSLRPPSHRSCQFQQVYQFCFCSGVHILEEIGNAEKNRFSVSMMRPVKLLASRTWGWSAQTDLPAP